MESSNAIRRTIRGFAVVAFLSVGFVQPALCVDKTKWMDLRREGQRLELDRAYSSAERYYLQMRQVARTFPKNCSERIETLYHIARIYVMQNKYWEAEIYYKNLVQIVDEQKKDGTLDHEALVWMEDLADAYTTNIKGWLESLALEHAVKLRDLVSGDANKYMATTLRKLSTILVNEGKSKEAEPYAERLVRLTSKFKGDAELVKASDLYFLSLVQCNVGKYAKAESNCREALTLFTKLEKPPGFCSGNCHVQLGKILKCQMQFELAEQSVRRALKIFERTHGKNYLPASAAHTLLGEIFTLRRKYADAAKEYEQVISIVESNCGPTNPLTVLALKDARAAYLKVGNTAKARAVERRLTSISKQNTVKKASNGH